MTYEEMTAALQDKMRAEQDQFKESLLKLSPENILAHAYQYIMQEDIVLSVDSNYLSVEQLSALLNLDKPLEAVYQQYISTDIDTLEPMRSCMVDRAELELQAVEQEQREPEDTPGVEQDAVEKPGAEEKRPSIREQLKVLGSHSAQDHAEKTPVQQR